MGPTLDLDGTGFPDVGVRDVMRSFFSIWVVVFQLSLLQDMGTVPTLYHTPSPVPPSLSMCTPVIENPLS